MNNWLKNTIFYQVYPTSFYDHNGDGVGDLKGIIEKLPYLHALGINGIWLNPFYPSPFKDGGYDVSDYYNVHEALGTLEDFELFVQRCKELQIRVVIDLVIGHTSDKHPWFLKSGEDEKNAYSDWYIWTDSNFNKYLDKSIHGLYPRDGGYVINYYACQPALNYGFNTPPRPANPDNAYDLGENWKMHYTDERLKPLREEIINVMRFWLAKGIDGFRVDLANSLVKGCVYNSDKDEDVAGLKWLWGKLIGRIKSEYPDAVFIAEWVYPSNSVGKCGFDLDYLAHDCPEYNDLFRKEKGTNILAAFECGKTYFSEEGKGTIENFLAYTKRLYEDVAGKGYFSVPSGYHDIVRLAEKKDDDLLKAVFAFLLTYKHVPFIYYGDEIGMRHTFGINKDGGYIRTGCRTPMQWNHEKNCGFSVADTTYLPVNAMGTLTVEDMQQDESSLLRVVQRLVNLRKAYSALNADAKQEILLCENGGYPLVYRRCDEKESLIIALNPGKESKKVCVNGEMVFGQNCFYDGRELTLNGKSFAIFQEE